MFGTLANFYLEKSYQQYKSYKQHLNTAFSSKTIFSNQISDEQFYDIVIAQLKKMVSPASFLQAIDKLAIKLKDHNQISKIKVLDKIKLVFFKSLNDDEEVVAENFFYDDIIHTIFDIAGYQCSIDRLKEILAIYENHINQSTFNKAKDLINTFIEKNRDVAENRFSDQWDSHCKTLLEQFNLLYQPNDGNLYNRAKGVLLLLSGLATGAAIGYVGSTVTFVNSAISLFSNVLSSNVSITLPIALYSLISVVKAEGVFESVFNVSSINGTNGEIFDKFEQDTRQEWPVDAVGVDLNDDGYEEVITTEAPYTNIKKRVEVIYGGPNESPDVNLNDTNTNTKDVTVILGAENTVSLLALGDMTHTMMPCNIDGGPTDLFLQQLDAAHDHRAFYIFGTNSKLPPIFDLKDCNGENCFEILGSPRFFSAFASPHKNTCGDFNADNYDDLVFCKDTSCYGINGGNKNYPPLIKLNETYSFIITDIDADEYNEAGIESADINCDGKTDLIICQHNKKNQIDIIYGPLPAVFSLSGITAENGMTIFGDNERIFGYKPVGKKDINGDECPDLIIPTLNNPPGKNGQIYAIFGSKTLASQLNVTQLNGANGFVINVPNKYEDPRYIVTLGNVNDDPYNDILVGSPGLGFGIIMDRNNTVYVYYGRQNFSASIDLDQLNNTDDGFRIVYDKTDAAFANTLSILDHNGDKIDDVLIGNSPVYNRTDAKAYLIYGRRAPQPPQSTTSANDFTTSKSSEQSLSQSIIALIVIGSLGVGVFTFASVYVLRRIANKNHIFEKIQNNRWCCLFKNSCGRKSAIQHLPLEEMEMQEMPKVTVN